jgi:ABC-type oligopeptide transport system ATPase subunit
MGSAATIFEHPRDDYTRLLLDAAPRPQMSTPG